MADLRITQLPVLASGSAAATDPLAIADVSASETKQITVKALVTRGVAVLDAASIPATALTYPLTAGQIVTATLADNAVTAVKITDATITGAKLANDTVTATQIAANAITSSELADASVDTAAIIDLNVTTAKLAANAVTTAKITDANVTYAKLSLSDGDIPGAKITADSITATQVAANAITASELADNAVDTAAIAANAITAAKITNDTITATQIAANAITASELADNAVDTAAIVDAAVTTAKIADSNVTTAKLATNAVTTVKITDANVTYAKLNLTDGDIPGAKITNDSITATQVAANAITASELADNAVDTAALVNLSVTAAKIANDTITATQVAANAIGSSELADNAVDSAAIAANAVTTVKITDSNVTTAKINNLAVTAAKIANDTITATQIAANAVGASELADLAVDTAAIASSAVTDAKIATGIAGTKITDGTVTAAKLNTSNLDRSLNVSGDNLGINNAVTGGASARSGITYNAEGLITATTALVASDLPEATTSAVGAISVPSAGGLSVTNLGALSIANAVSGGAATRSGITYDAKGLITATAALAASDLPVATASAVGGISVPAGSAPLAVSGAGVISISDSGVSAGTYEKVTVNAKGIITGGTDLAAGDIPSLDASKITTGSLATARIADDAITMDKLGNGAISFIQEAQPDITNLPTGVYWLQESTGQLRIFNGNSWFSVGFGRLAEENLRFCGTVNGTNGIIITLTTFGTSAGFSAGNAIPAGTATTTGSYFVCTVSGNGIAVVPNTSFDAGDWVMCMGLNDWDRVDTLSGPGSVSALDDLSDVSINSPTAGQFFEYASDGQWKNVSEISGGTY